MVIDSLEILPRLLHHGGVLAWYECGNGGGHDICVLLEGDRSHVGLSLDK